MKEYIKWFLEDVLGKPYKDMNTIKLWQIENKSVQRNEDITNIKSVNISEKQMSIYDIL
ncbi:hypothetical protein K4Q45_10605 [Staphylococcus epidermidis]|uniref:hypothetical protein n=1 Tax=Staphylococcus epidermidis TaxID=1282 RepID=UPI00163CE5DE|nr:hypothetical protein [Staphylococcus epidermidis]MCG1337824.1 hypothetical protein [Staphylococcus epidermidis]MCG1432335.1 hypothetical protein [Staphylococcus epidermidis]MCG1621426.1 hypothetical protein [Staphylococcus epidermidis]MCG1741640.1 hypothetical protein [Staphylococcus epidermidis]MCG1858120.1 hypothetical protein [Staphylococcus epidermidis]